MARPPSQKKLLAEDFPDLQWFPRFAEVMNRFMEDVTRALTRQLTFGENLDAVVQTVTVDGTYPVKFRWDRNLRPLAAWVGQCREISENHTTRSTAIDLDWEYTANGEFQINAIPGLSASMTSKFNVTIVAITG